jgi:hypothetical protein
MAEAKAGRPGGVANELVGTWAAGRFVVRTATFAKSQIKLIDAAARVADRGRSAGPAKPPPPSKDTGQPGRDRYVPAFDCVMQ